MPKKKYPKDPHENKAIFFDRNILISKAYWDLSGAAPQYLMVLYGRRQMKYMKANDMWVQRNNGEIVFTYAEAKSRYGINAGKHSRALKKLYEVGFIDINHLGGGMEGDCTTFFISKRWKEYGTPEFEEKEWPKDTRRKGNPKIQKYGKGRTNG